MLEGIRKFSITSITIDGSPLFQGEFNEQQLAINIQPKSLHVDLFKLTCVANIV